MEIEPGGPAPTRDFTITVEQVGTRIRAVIELTPTPGDRRLGKVIDALYSQARALPLETAVTLAR